MAQARTEFAAALNQIASEKGVEVEVVLDAIRQAALAAYKKDLTLRNEPIPENFEEFTSKVDPASGEITIFDGDKNVTPAGFIDGLIIGVIPGMVFKENGNVLSFLLGLGYSVWMLSNYSATVGMMVLKIKITKESGGKITYKGATLRYFASILSGIALGIGYLWMIWDPKKQTWHDRIAKTVVVNV